MPIHSPTSVPLIGKPRSTAHFWHGESRESGRLHPNQMNPVKKRGPPKETEVLFPEEGEGYGGPELALKSKTPVHPRHLSVAIVLSTVQEAEIISIVVPAKGVAQCLLREIRPADLK